MTHSAFDFGLLIDAEQLVPHLGNDKLRIVDLSRASVYDQLHIPHALHLKPKYPSCKFTRNSILRIKPNSCEMGTS